MASSGKASLTTMTRADWGARIGRRITLKDLNILSAAVHCGSMAKAAAHLSTTQSVISGAIANLESEVGVRLLDRTPRGVEPTLYCRALLDRSHVVFDELRQAMEEIESLSRSAVGDVRIACAEFMAGGIVSDLVTAFAVDHPEITCEVVDAQASTLEFRQLRDRQVDVIVTRVPRTFTDPALTIEILFEDAHAVAAGVDHHLAGNPDVELADLVSEHWVLPGAMVYQSALTQSFHRIGLAPPRCSVICSPFAMRKRLVETGRFLTILPQSVLLRPRTRDSFHTLPVQLTSTPGPVAAVLVKDRTISPSVELLLTYLRKIAMDYREMFNAAPSDGVSVPEALPPLRPGF